MVYKPLPAGERRDFMVQVRFKPQVKAAIEHRRKQLSEEMGKELTVSEFIRYAVWKYCQNPDDPRSP